MTINNTIYSILSLILFFSCSQEKKKEVVRSNEQILQEITEITAIGKVISAEDDAVIAGSSTSSRIKNIFIQNGDTVQKGQLLIELEVQDLDFDISESRAKLTSLRATHKTTTEDLKKAKVYADELEQKYKTSQKLYQQNAETKEKLETDYSNWQQQLLSIKEIELQQRAQLATEKEQEISIQRADHKIKDFKIYASKSGIISDLNAKLGQYISGTQDLGKIINTRNVLVEAEVDELFANDVQLNQQVTLFAIGRKDTLAQGKVSYVSPILSNKSILYESANEGEDRRVRLVKIALNTSNNIIINAKVSCQIKIK